MAIKTILVSQPKPEGNKSPYFDLAERHGLKIDFRSFIQVEGIDAQEFRSQKIDVKAHTAIILTSKTAVDHFFRISGELRFEVPDTMKYFCISEAVAYYLQKYVTYRKRKIFFGKQTIEDLKGMVKVGTQGALESMGYQIIGVVIFLILFSFIGTCNG